MLKSLISALALLACGIAQAYDDYILGHADDWQLFMGEKAFDDIVSSERVIFVYVTAGDAGYRAGGWGSVPMYLAREEGAIASASIATSVLSKWYPADQKTTVTLNGHPVTRIIHRNTWHYFLRLPNGAPDGNGYAGDNFESLARFRTGAVSTITTVDGSTTYTSYADLAKTLQTLLNQWAPGRINLAEMERTINPGIHSDHYEAGRLTLAAFNNGATGFRFWQDYNTALQPPNLATEPLVKKASLLGGMAHAMTVRGYNGVYHPWHNQFLPRSYMREVPAPYTLTSF